MYTNVHWRAKKWKQSKFPLADERINKEMVYPYNEILLGNQKERKVLIHATTCINLENTIQSGRTQSRRKYIVWFHLCEISRLEKSIYTESNLEVARSRGRGKWGVIVNTMEFLWEMFKSVLKLNCGDAYTSLQIY